MWKVAVVIILAFGEASYGQGSSPVDPFSILDNDLAMTCKPFDRALDVLVILDGSGSVSGNTFETQLHMVRRMLDVVEIGPDKTRLALAQYAGHTKIEFVFNQFTTKDEIRAQLDKVRYISGTTRTGKALRKAGDTFQLEKGARIDRPDVAQVVVVVTDGHSQDDPVPAAEELRKSGIIVLAVGIGEYVNMDELLEITRDAGKTFRNDSLDKFEETFRKIAVGEECQFAKGPKGAEITCGNETITVNILTRKPFQGRLYVKGHYKDPFCSVRGGRLVGDPREISLRIPLNSCGVREQFIFHPRGVLFETAAVLMFHPDYNTAVDKAFTIRCFYPDSRFGGPNFTEIIHSDEEATLENDLQSGLVYSVSVPNMRPPCAYTLRKQGVDGCFADTVSVGDMLHHRWECDTGEDRSEYDMLVHSCHLSDEEGQKRVVIDSKGCSIDPVVLGTPTYSKQLFATVEAPVVKFADRAILKFKCSLKFCNRQKGECAGVTPPDCVNANSTVPRAERDVAFRDSPRLAHFFQSRRNGSSLSNDQVSFANSTKERHGQGIRPSSRVPSLPTLPPPFTSVALTSTANSNGTLVRAQSIDLQLPPVQSIFVLSPNSSDSQRSGSFAVIREFDPYELSETVRPKQGSNETSPSANVGITSSPKSVLNTSNSSANPEPNVQFRLYTTSFPIPAQQSVPQVQTGSSDFTLKGLSHKIVALIDFSRVELESQSVMVHDAEDGFEHKSPLNICK